MASRALASSGDDEPRWRRRLRGYRAAVGGDRPLGWLLVLWPTLWALWLAARGRPPLGLLLAFVCGALLLRAACRAIDGYFGSLLDARAGRIARFPPGADEADPREVALLCAGLLGAVALLVSTLNLATVWLSVSWAVLALGYLLVKRHLYLGQVYVGVLAGGGVPLAFAAVTGEVPAAGWTLYVATVFWITGCELWRSMAARDDDLLSGAKSIAILLGEVDLAAQAVLHGCMLFALLLVGRSLGMGGWYWAGLLLAFALLLPGYAAARRRSPEGYLRALRGNGWIGAAVWLGVMLDWALRVKEASA